jgi:outer membrane protein assembly factor BamB
MQPSMIPFFLAALAFPVQAHASDWPRFRGPNGSGVAESSALPDSIGPDKHVVWKTALPAGHSSPAISGDRIFLTGFEGDRLLTLALDRGNGKILWRREAPRDRHEKLDTQNSPSSPTPAADGHNVYVFFPDYGLLSYTFDGKERWRTRLGPFDNMYGMGVSPILAGDKVVLICDQMHDSFAAAFSQADGKQAWKTPRPEALSGHSTPIVYRPQGAGGGNAGNEAGIQIIAPGSFRLDAYDLASGKSAWWVNGLASEMKSVPVLDGDTIYINGFNSSFNDPGKHIPIPSFADALAQYDSNQDGALQQAELPEGPMRLFFPFEDLNHDGKLNEAEWKSFQAVMAAENGLLALHAGGAGDMTSTALRWKYQSKVPQLPSTLLYRGVIYMINDGGILTTIDPANGTAFKQGRLRGAVDKYYASPVAADGKVFFVGNSGVVTILKAGPDQEILSVAELDDECFATPAIADGRIYIRTRGMLYCFGL